MARTVSFTPPDRDASPGSGRAVRRRRVLYVPGYDPDAEARSRMLFVRELIRYAKRFGFTERRIGRSEPLESLLGFSWDVACETPLWSTHTRVDVLRWDDIVARDFRRPLPVAIGLLFAALLYSLVTGGLVRLWRISWVFGCVILYPPVMVALALGVSGGAGIAVDRLAHLGPGLPDWFASLLGLATAAATLAALYPLGRRWFVWHLMHDWLFNWQHGCGLRADYEGRVDAFAAHLADALSDATVDEVLVVGHSSGAPMATELVGAALSRVPAGREQGPVLSLLTLGSCMPLVAMNVLAERCRERIAALIESDRVTWVEYQAPQDWLNFAGFNPARDLPRLRETHRAFNPIIRSTKFKEIVAPETYATILNRPFRMHFQFLMANDAPGEYDYIRMLVGPQTLGDRVLSGAVGDPGLAPELTSEDLARTERDRGDYELRDGKAGR